MNWIDTIIMAILAFNLWTGLRRGLIRAFFDIVGSLVAIYAAMQTLPTVSQWILSVLHLPQPVGHVLCFGLIWLFVFGVVQIVASAVSEIFNRSLFAPLNHFGGMLIGLVRGTIMALLIFIPLMSIPFLPVDINSSLHGSVILGWSQPMVKGVVPGLTVWARQAAVMDQLSLPTEKTQVDVLSIEQFFN